MITNTKQDWSIGKVVKVGFLSLVVRDMMNFSGVTKYVLTSKDSTKLYYFTPHLGLERVDTRTVGVVAISSPDFLGGKTDDELLALLQA